MTVAKWTEAQKAEALALAQEEGNGQAARSLGIPRQTIQRWMAAAGVEPATTEASGRTAVATEAARRRREFLRERLRTRLLERANMALDLMDRPHVDFKGDKGQKVLYPRPPATAVQAYATTAGILLDKYRLEVGEATGRTEHRDLTHDDHEAGLLRDAIRGELARRHSESARAADDRAAEAGVDAPAVAVDAAPEPGGSVG